MPEVGNPGNDVVLGTCWLSSPRPLAAGPPKPEAPAGREDLSMGIHAPAQLQHVGPVPPGFVLQQLLLV